MGKDVLGPKEPDRDAPGRGSVAGPIGVGPRHFLSGLGKKEKARDARRTIRRLWQYLGQQKGGLVLGFLLILLGNGCALAGPYLIGRGVDAMAGGPGAVDFSLLGAILGWLLASYLLSALATAAQTYVMAGVSLDTVRSLRRDLFGKMQQLPVRFFDRHAHGELMSRMTNDVENINATLTQSVTQITSSLITVLGSLAMMIWISPLLAVISLSVIPLGILLTRQVADRTRQYYAQQQKELGALNGVIEETIAGQKAVKAFSREAEVMADFAVVNQRLRTAGTKALIFTGLIPPLMNVVSNLSFALVACGGGWLALQGALTIGVIASFLNYSRLFARPINEIANQFNMIQSAVAGAERVFQVMDEETEFLHQEGLKTVPPVCGQVSFRDVTFGYDPERPVLRNLNIEAEPGQTIALVGPTGAGKTTIVNLLTRFYEVDGGEIIVEGENIRNLRKDSLRRSMGIVLQDTYLFAETVRENIRYGRLEASDREVEEAARIANAEPFILRLPNGYDTVLQEEGGNLSQGQRQLLSIARAVLADPCILILDEATSNVDTRTEMNLQAAMLNLMRGRTSFVVAHRLSTIRGADQILVLRDGSIVERGNHRQLMAARGFYYDLFTSQFNRTTA